MDIKRISRKGMNYFFQGLLFIAPITLTAWGIFTVFNFIDGILIQYLDEMIGRRIPGLGLIVLVVSITLIGILGSTIVFRPMMNYFDSLLVKAPLIKILYSSVKDLVSAFVGQKKRFTEPVLVQVGDTGMEKLGFVTNNDLAFLGLGKTKLAVYLPHSYAWSGNLYIVPADRVKPVEASAADVMKFIISAGVINLEQSNEK